MKGLSGSEEKMDMTEVELINDRLKKRCICPDCPSYDECAKMDGELLFCSYGRSQKCIENEKGCTCPDCPVFKKLELKNSYYCTRGSEREQEES